MALTSEEHLVPAGCVVLTSVVIIHVHVLGKHTFSDCECTVHIPQHVASGIGVGVSEGVNQPVSVS